MQKVGLIRAILYLSFSIFIMGLGISLVVHADLGTSAVTAIPLVVSELVPFTFGQVTMAFNILLVILQVLLIGKQFPFIQYFQLIISIALGYAIDFWGIYVMHVEPPHYLLKLLMSITGCFVIAVSIVIQLKADLINNPGEGIIRAIALRFNTEFNRIKMPFDICLVILAVSISLLTLGHVVGVREGTLISAVLVGLFMKLIQGYRKKSY